jgi:two-component system cell cycle response regulator
MVSAVDTRITKGELRLHRGEDNLVVIYTREDAELGCRYVLDRDVITIGRDPDNDIALESDAVSRFHARIDHRGDDVTLADLSSTNGTFVNNERAPVTTRRLCKGDHIKVGDTIFKYLSGSDIETQYHEAIFKLTITDGLTEVGNAKYLPQVLGQEVPRARRHGRQLALLMMDLDYFKQVNDTYGHLAGDAVLREVAQIGRQRLRPGDTLARYGGEEFCAVLPETSVQGAVRLARELRERIEGHRFVFEGQSIQVTVSIGAAELRDGLGQSG